MTDKQLKALTFIESSMAVLKDTVLYKKWLITVLKNNIDEVEIVNNLFLLKTRFYIALLDHIKQNERQIYSRKKEVKLDSGLYKFFNALKRKDFIHKASSYFPKSLRLLSINPNPFNMLNVNFSQLDLFTKEISRFRHQIEHEISLQNLYIYLRLYHPYPFTKQMLETLLIDDVIVISKEKCVLILYYKLFIETKANNRIYKTVVLNQQAAFMFYSLQQQIHLNTDDKRVFQNIVDFEEQLKVYKEKYLTGVSMLLMKSINKTYYSFQGNTLTNTLITKTINSVPLSIAEINKRYTGFISKDQLEMESEYIEKANKRFENVEIQHNEYKEYFDLYKVESLEKIMKSNQQIESVENISNAIKGIHKEMKVTHSETYKLIYAYINYQLKKVLIQKIRLKTFQNYIYTLNKHIFSMIEDINKIKDNEIQAIMQRFENNNYAKNTIDTINSAFKRFFLYLRIQGFVIDIPSLLYPKSMIFIEEIDKLLFEIEERHSAYNSVRQTDRIKFILLQKKVILIFAFYSGLRKKEIWTRRLKDIYFDNNSIYIDVNPEGMKNLGLKLKTTNSLRRVEVLIENQEHLNIVLQWWKLRSKIRVDTQYLFVKTIENKIYSKIVDESIFDEYNAIIKKITQRYASFHSCRHSYATYSLKKILEKSSNNKAYDFLELSIQMGHQAPEMTANKYIHFELIQLL